MFAILTYHMLFFTSGTPNKLKLGMKRWVMEEWEQPYLDPHLKIHLPRLVSLDSSAEEDVVTNVFGLIEGSPALDTLTLSGLRKVPPAAQANKYLYFRSLNLINGLALPVLFCLLDRCPFLLKLHVSKLDRPRPIMVFTPPWCIQGSLTTVNITDCDGKESPEYWFFKYVLSRAPHMTKLTLNCSHDIRKHKEAEVCKELDRIQSDKTGKCSIYLYEHDAHYKVY